MNVVRHENGAVALLFKKSSIETCAKIYTGEITEYLGFTFKILQIFFKKATGSKMGKMLFGIEAGLGHMRIHYTTLSTSVCLKFSIIKIKGKK